MYSISVAPRKGRHLFFVIQFLERVDQLAKLGDVVGVGRLLRLHGTVHYSVQQFQLRQVFLVRIGIVRRDRLYALGEEIVGRDLCQLGGVPVLEGQALRLERMEWSESPWYKEPLYRRVESKKPKPLPIRLVPYHTWANRGRSEMTVFMPIDW